MSRFPCTRGDVNNEIATKCSEKRRTYKQQEDKEDRMEFLPRLPYM